MKKKINRVYRCQINRLNRALVGFVFGNKKLHDFVSKNCHKLFSKLFYYRTYQKYPNLSKPKDFNEKLLFLKMTEYSTNQYIADCADKYKVREILQSKGFGNLCTKLYGSYKRTEDIDYSILPNKFVVKLNHGSGYNIICKDKSKFDIESANKQLNIWMSEDYGLYNGEWHYSNIKPVITIEEYIDALEDDSMLIDYKFNCFNGKVNSIFICYDRTPKSVKFDIYTPQWERTDYIKPEHRGERRLLSKPQNLEEMIKIAETLSLGFKFVRVDLYNINDRVYFGEFTFSPHSCTCEYYTQDFLNELGDCLIL